MRTLFLLLIVLCCPLMMMFMMRGMHGGHDKNPAPDQPGHTDPPAVKASTSDTSGARIAELEREVADLHAAREHDESTVSRR